MVVYEITGTKTGVARDGVNFLEPSDSYQNMFNGFIYRQILQSRFGFKQFSLRRVSNDFALDNTRVLGIFENILVNAGNNVRETLAITKKYLYIYNDTTNVFDRIPMNSADPIGDFGIDGDSSYVSGTTYPFKNGSNRFVFTGKGMLDTYFYDPTPITGGVKRFTNIVDNPDYAPPLVGFPPTPGTLKNAWYVVWFGERLNLFNPLVSGLQYPQSVFYSGIKNAEGNGDKFNVPGAGRLPADTFEYINGISILGNVIIANFSQSNWVLEKTRDAFNPYFWRKVPSVLGTDASFSFESWNDEVRSFGRTGIIKTDNRQSLRIDNKIPYFTAQDMDQSNFDLTYGGFDPIRGQFLFSYLSIEADESIAEESITQDKVLINNYEENTWAINDERFSVFGNSTNGINIAMEDIYEGNDPSGAWAQMDTTLDIWNEIGIGEETQKTLAGDNDGFIYELNKEFDDYRYPITGITAAFQAVLTVSDSAFKAGDRIAISGVIGMVNINGESINNFDPENPYDVVAPYTVISSTNTTVTINLNTSLYTPYSSGGSITKIINFYAETIPFNPFREEGRLVRITHVEFLLDTNAGYLQVDAYQDEEETPFKTNILIQPKSTTKERQWVTMSVDNEANFMTFVLKQESPALQVRLTSMRIHCEKGGYTSA